MLNFDEVYISDIPPAISIATWYIHVKSSKLRIEKQKLDVENTSDMHAVSITTGALWHVFVITLQVYQLLCGHCFCNVVPNLFLG